jgi:hypothetical protein
MAKTGLRDRDWYGYIAPDIYGELARKQKC